MSKQKVIKTVNIIGSGAAGLTSAIFCAKSGARVNVLERTKESGKKILLSGGTRCNLLPVEVNLKEDFFSSNEHIMQKIFKSWSLSRCYDWLSNDIGICLEKEIDSNKWFPRSNSAREVRDLLQKKRKILESNFTTTLK
eukprot:TRINITY_DN11244_c0_g1_i1.p1 TRINITY_DN11244_c0_g1~~TRINITY_DN11244_c0_g1_i1.p1  ORF type:complete len:139 (-),score=18.00 TRINITY_DN11244_c0_g1_i1:402-818(-)